MTISTDQTRTIHEAYNRLVLKEGIKVPYSMSLHFRWEVWLSQGFTQADLAVVVNYLRNRIRIGKREVECLDPRNLLGSADDFACTLSMARAKARIPHSDPAKAEVLRSTGRAEKATTGTARSAADILAGDEAFRRFRDAGREL